MDQRAHTVQSYTHFLKERDVTYVKVPRSFLADPKLTDREKLLWIVLASFQFRAGSKIYPGRKLLAQIMHVKNPANISRLTKSLQLKGYLEKFYAGPRGNMYKLYYDAELDDSIFSLHGKIVYKANGFNIINHPDD